MLNIKENFFDWCIKNNIQDALYRWDYELNKISPHEISSWDKNKYFFKCNNNIHNSELHSPFFIRRYKKITQCNRCNSFGMWCVNNNKLDLLQRWDCELNKTSPFEVSYCSGKKYWFKCPKGIHESEMKYVCNLIKQSGTERCNQCISIGQYLIDTYGENGINLYWSDKNYQNPYKISSFSTNKYWFKCTEVDYHDDYECSCVNFISNKRCSYCAKKKIHKFDSLGYLYPEVLKVWSNKNKKSPYEYFPLSNKNVLWKCMDDKHEDYERKISESVKRSFYCPLCISENNISLLQTKVSNYLNSLSYDIKHEQYCTLHPINPKTNMYLRYDNEVVNLKLIIEVHGIQHYEITNLTIMSSEKNNKKIEEEFEYQKWKDDFKRNYALEHGYFYLEIPYWSDDKNETYKKLINEKINLIKSNILIA